VQGSDVAVRLAGVVAAVGLALQGALPVEGATAGGGPGPLQAAKIQSATCVNRLWGRGGGERIADTAYQSSLQTWLQCIVTAV